MRNSIRRWVEQAILIVMASVGFVVVIGEHFGFERFFPADLIPKVTLLVLSTVTVFLLLELERFQSLDNIDARLSELDIKSIAQKLKREHYAGIVAVHKRFPEETFIRYVKSAREVTILNTWIPNLQSFEQLLIDALNRKAKVRILLLFPHSGVAQLRDDALRTVRDPKLADNVQDGVERCLATLALFLNGVGEHRDVGLEVRVYNSLPSIAVYKADTHYLVSTFLHGQLAIDSPQFEIDGTDTILGRQIQRELDTLWGIGRGIDVRNWQAELRNITF